MLRYRKARFTIFVAGLLVLGTIWGLTATVLQLHASFSTLSGLALGVLYSLAVTPWVFDD